MRGWNGHGRTRSSDTCCTAWAEVDGERGDGRGKRFPPRTSPFSLVMSGVFDVGEAPPSNAPSPRPKAGLAMRGEWTPSHGKSTRRWVLELSDWSDLPDWLDLSNLSGVVGLPHCTAQRSNAKCNRLLAKCFVCSSDLAVGRRLRGLGDVVAQQTLVGC